MPNAVAEIATVRQQLRLAASAQGAVAVVARTPDHLDVFWVGSDGSGGQQLVGRAGQQRRLEHPVREVWTLITEGSTRPTVWLWGSRAASLTPSLSCAPQLCPH